MVSLPLVAACGGSDGSVATSAVSTTSASARIATATPAAASTPTGASAGFLGVNISANNYWGGDRQFMNLLAGSAWQDSSASGWPYLSAAQIDQSGNLISLSSGQRAARVLVPPTASQSGNGAAIKCSWVGTGTVQIAGAVQAGSKVVGDHTINFFFPGNLNGALTWLEVSSTQPSDPVRNLDCRETDADPQAVFAPEFVSALKPFGILRFLDWSGANGNPQDPQWADRTQESGLDQRTAAWENMAKLASSLDADAWYNVPYAAGQDYVVRLGQLIHDLTPANRKVYVELGNEVWNTDFGNTTQARQEGLAEGLDTSNPAHATLLRYAEKSTWLMKLWTPIFADRPGQLVRVVSTQDVNSSSADQVLGFRDTAQWVDALATAPYFAYGLMASNPTADAATLLPLVATAASNTLATSAQANAAIAKRYGKRYIAYEGGQALSDGTRTDRMLAVNRADAMYDIYKSYIAGWKAQFGDTLMLYSSTVAISGAGAWGLRERAGQQATDAPKYRAAIEFSR